MDAIILLRYENEYYTFDRDAEIVSRILEIKPEQDKEKMTCHLPHYHTDWLLPKLVKAGYRVALCEPLYFKANL
jgi:DNA mismatch repair ATPase MutS